jgi:hypothetical protein
MKLVKSEEAPPATLSHYTTLEGLKGIVETGLLWASNASFLNDKAELSHALKVAKLAIVKLSSEKTMKQWSPMLKKVIAEFEDGGVPDTFVACFCRSDDNLSQWRGYGGTVQGVSLTFDRKKISKRLEPDKAAFFKVQYSKLSTAQKLSTALSEEIGKLAGLDELVGEPNETQRYNELRDRVSALLPRFKHLGFADEREWRYAIQRKVEPKDLRFRVSNNKVVPYIMIGASHNPLPITAARIGPGPDQELTMRSVKLFLNSSGYDVPVTMSEVPFRP